jgi:hypothetical protein
MGTTALEQLKEWDASRPSFPAEHELALAAGVGLWLAARNSDSFLLRVGGKVMAVALIVRAATGRDGLARRWLPL